MAFPPDFIHKMVDLVGKEHVDSFLSSLSLPRKKTIRINTLKADAQHVVETLSHDGFVLSPVSWYPDAYCVEKAENLSTHPLHEQGLIYMQSLSSMIPTLVLSPCPHETILDITAAPGSKTTQIAQIMGNTGSIVANDISRNRLFKLESNLSRMGVANTNITHFPAELIWKKFEPGTFDRTLADVPCSMEGRFSAQNPETYRDWSEKKVKTLSKEQKAILRSAIRATKPGGVIVYSTCTFSPEENEEVIDWILAKEAVEVVPISIPGLDIKPGITQWQGKTLHPDLAHTARIYPTDTMEGFFVALLSKVYNQAA